MRELLVRSISPLTGIYSFIFPSNYGAKCILRHGDEILLVRNVHGTRLWSFPGGGVENGESPAQAVVREVREEVGVIPKNVMRGGTLRATPEYRRHGVHWFIAEAHTRSLRIDPREILEAGWFALDFLPKNITPMTRKILRNFKKPKK